MKPKNPLTLQKRLHSPFFWGFLTDAYGRAGQKSRTAIPFSFPQRLRGGEGGIYLDWGLGVGEESFCEVSAAGGGGDGEWDGERESEREAGSGREEL